MAARVWNVWLRITRERDEWVAHCLDFDVFSQGRTLAHAFEMIGEAISIAVTSDLEEARDPHDRRAPEEFWVELYSFVRNGRQVKPADVVEAGLEELAACVEFRLDTSAATRPELAWEPSKRPAMGSDACAPS